MSKSGKIILRIPKSVHEQAAECAKSDDISLNQWLASVVSMAVARRQLGQAVVPQDRLESIAVDAFCEFPECASGMAKAGLCAACDAIYAAREAIASRCRSCPDCGCKPSERPTADPKQEAGE